MWLAVFCLVALGLAIVIKVAAPPASLVVAPTQDQSKPEPAFVLNEAAKSDRLELPNARAEPGIIVPTAKLTPAEAPLATPETVTKVEDQRWRNANASIVPVTPPRRHRDRKESKQSADKSPPRKRAEVWHCRQDAVGGLLRSLDLSPRCNL
jgi:hypothetical protein